MELYRRKGSRKWWMTYSIGGKRYRESTGTEVKRLAEAVLAKHRVEIFEGRFFPDKKRNELTVEGLQDKWLKHAKHKRSLDKDEQRFKVIVKHFKPNRLIGTMTQEECEGFRDSLAETITRRGKPMAPATVNRHLALLRSAFRHVAKSNHHRDPMSGMKFLAERNQRDRECEPEELETLLGVASPELRLAIVLGHEAGLRRTEVARALRKHVRLRHREIHIPPTDSKNDQPRDVPLTRMALEEIKAIPARMDGKLLSLKPDTISHQFSALCADLNIEGLVFHDLRGTAITRLARAGATLAELQKFSGHKSVAALMRYLKRGDRRLRKLIDEIDAEHG